MQFFEEDCQLGFGGGSALDGFGQPNRRDPLFDLGGRDDYTGNQNLDLDGVVTDRGYAQ